MNPHHSPPERVGWFGKIPALGDFVTRHLPPSFVQPWDEWLSAELSEARLLLADTWAETYQQAVAWDPRRSLSSSQEVIHQQTLIAEAKTGLGSSPGGKRLERAGEDWHL